MKKLYIPLSIIAYKFIIWYRYSKFLQSIHRVSSFSEFETFLKLNGIIDGSVSSSIGSSSGFGDSIFLSLYSKINSTSPLLSSGINTVGEVIIGGNGNGIGSTAAASVITSTPPTLLTTTIGSTANSIAQSLIPISTNNNNLNNGFLAIKSTSSLIFEGAASSSNLTLTSTISEQYNSVPSFNLTDLTNKTVNIITDEVIFPLEKNFTKFIPNNLNPSTFMKVLEYIFGKRKLLGQLIEEKVLKPNIRLFTVLSCKVGKFGNDIQYRLVNLPFQFSESKFENEINNAKFKTILYGSLFGILAGSIILYYGIPFLRQYYYNSSKYSDLPTSYEQTQRSCSVCYESPRDVVFLPCAHVVTCFSCSSMITTCPICRYMIQTKKKIIFS